MSDNITNFEAMLERLAESVEDQSATEQEIIAAVSERVRAEMQTTREALHELIREHHMGRYQLACDLLLMFDRVAHVPAQMPEVTAKPTPPPLPEQKPNNPHGITYVTAPVSYGEDHS